MRIEYHRTLLADRVRNAAFDAALAKVVRKGETVVTDIGAGTGLMGFLALKHGAKHVYAYESAGVISVAEKIAKLNRLRSWEPVPGLSTDVIDPPRVDLVVSETLGNYAFEEDIITTLNDARERHLKPGGTIVPRAVSQFVCPVVSARLYRELCLWDEVGFGLDLTPAKIMSLNNIYVRNVAPAELLDGGEAARQWDHVDFNRKNRTKRAGEAEWRVERATEIHGAAIWWRADLMEGVALGTGPLDPPTHWEQLYLPVLEPMRLEAGHGLRVTLRSTSSPEQGTDIAWGFQHLDKAGRVLAKQNLSLDKGFLP